MVLISRLKSFSGSVKKELMIYRLVLKDPRTPVFSKLLLSAAIGYLLLPFDLIPDFIPVLGQIDDLIIVPGLIFLSLKLIPENIIEEYRHILNEPGSHQRI